MQANATDRPNHAVDQILGGHRSADRLEKRHAVRIMILCRSDGIGCPAALSLRSDEYARRDIGCLPSRAILTPRAPGFEGRIDRRSPAVLEPSAVGRDPPVLHGSVPDDRSVRRPRFDDRSRIDHRAIEWVVELPVSISSDGRIGRSVVTAIRRRFTSVGRPDSHPSNGRVRIHERPTVR